MQFYFVQNTTDVPTNSVNSVYLIYDNWDDFGFSTTFGIRAFDENGKLHELPRFSIGFAGQTISKPTYRNIKNQFKKLPKRYFSVCGSVDYYKTLYSDFSQNWREDYLHAIRDVVRYPEILEEVKDEEVFQTSHLRSVRIDQLRDQ